MTESELCSDTQLVERCLGGDREAFGRIVERYQGLVCALAYNACGDIGKSEDLAQETFLAAWRNLNTLRDGGRLKPWLCGIVRHIIQEFHRRATRDPMAASALLDEEVTGAGNSLQPGEQMISREEQAILWRVLEGLPATYREPLILFYRQEQSVAEVAEAMELSEDAVKQRLSRGRTILTERTAKFVETALRTSGPGKAFTLGVLAALPALATSAKAATIAATAAKGSTLAKSATLVSVLNFLIGPIAGFLGSFLGAHFAFRSRLARTRTPRERRTAIRHAKIVISAAALFCFSFAFLCTSWGRLSKAHTILWAVLGVVIPLAYVIFLFVASVRFSRERQRIRAEERERHPELFQGEVGLRPIEYRSRWTFLGLPLLHVRLDPTRQHIQPAVGWIAVGNWAYGILCAVGGVAVGGVSLGGVSLGLISVGGATVGLLATGGFALGAWAIGGFGIGIEVLGGFTAAWQAAQGGVAIAREFALGGLAFAKHANDQIARDYFATHPWFDIRSRYALSATDLIFLSVMFFIWQSIRIRRAARHNKETGGIK